MKSRLMAIAMCLAMVVSLSVPRAQAEGTLDDVTVILPRSAECLDDVDFIVADEIGYFEENGISIHFEEATGTSDMMMVVMGQGEVCFPDPMVMMLGKDGGLDVKAFYQRDNIAENCLVVNSDSDIRELKDIAGHSVALIDASMQLCIDPVLLAIGVDPATVEYVVGGGSCAQMVVSGKADAAFSWEKGYQLWQAQGLDVRPLKFSDFVEMVGNPLVTSNELIQSNPDLLKRFCRALAQAEYWVMCNPDAAAEIVMNRFPSIDISHEDAVKVIDAAILLWTSAAGYDEYGFGYVGEAAWENTIRYSKASGAVTGDYTYADVYTNEFVSYANDFDHDKVKADAEAYQY